MSIRAMSQAAVTMNQLQHQIDMIGNNMSNSATPGYKQKEQLSFLHCYFSKSII